MKKILRILIGLVVLILVAYLVFINIPQANVKSKEVMERVSATALYDSYVEDEAAADGRYMGKVLEVDGVIYEKYEDENGAPVVVLEGSDGEPVVLITLEPGEATALADYEEGSPIRVKAMCSGLLMEVALTKGIIVK